MNGKLPITFLVIRGNRLESIDMLWGNPNMQSQYTFGFTWRRLNVHSMSGAMKDIENSARNMVLS